MLSFKEFYLTEMPRGISLTDDKRLEIGVDIEAGKISYKAIGKKHGISLDTVKRIANELEVGRNKGGTSSPLHSKNLTGSDKHHRRILSNAQEERVLDYWLANHHEMTLLELARWASQQFNVDIITGFGIRQVLKRAVARYPDKRLPPSDRGKGNRLKIQRDLQKKQHATNPTGIPTVKTQHFKGSTSTPPSNPDHGGNPDTYPSP